MVSLELSVAARWIYLKASGVLDYWDNACDVLYKEAIEETKRLGLSAILCDARDLSAEFGPWKVAGSYYMLRQRLGGIRLAYVMSDKFVGPSNYAQQVAQQLDVPAKAFRSLKDASCWLEKEVGERNPRLVVGATNSHPMQDTNNRSFFCARPAWLGGT